MAKSTLPPPSPSPPPQPPVQSHASQEDSPSSDEDGVEQFVANGSPAGTNSGSGSDADGDDAAEPTSYVYLRSLLQELIDKHRFVGWHTVDDLISQIRDSSRLRRFEAEAKALRIEKFKFLARERHLIAEVFGSLAAVLSNNDK